MDEIKAPRTQHTAEDELLDVGTETEHENHPDSAEENSTQSKKKKGHPQSVWQRFRGGTIHNQLTIIFTGLIFLATGTYALFSGWQLSVMKAQLQEMRSSYGDTHQLATEAKNQADRTKDVADRALLQANATNDLAKQAKRSADLSESTSHLDERAWVGPNAIVLVNPPIEVNKETLIGVNFCNSGKTPALNLVGYADAELITSKVTVDFSRFVSPPGLDKNVLFPGVCHHFQRSIQALPEGPVFEDMKHGSSKIIVFGLIQYDDIFRRKHWTHFCMSYSMTVKGFVSCGRYNETDDE